MSAEGLALPEESGIGFGQDLLRFGRSGGTNNALLNHLYELAWLQYLGSPLPEDKVIRYFPVLLYSNADDDFFEHLNRLSSAIVKTFEVNDFVLVGDLPARTGSFWKEFVFKTKTKVTDIQFKEQVNKAGKFTHKMLKKAEEGAKTINEMADAYENLCKLGKKAIVIVGIGTTLLGIGHKGESSKAPDHQSKKVSEQTIKAEDLYKNRNDATGLEKLVKFTLQNPGSSDLPRRWPG